MKYNNNNKRKKHETLSMEHCSCVLSTKFLINNLP